jgi:hypothetical protein
VHVRANNYIQTKMEAIADDLWKVYNKEWREARLSLKIHKHDEEIIYLLMQLVRVRLKIILMEIIIFAYLSINAYV